MMAREANKAALTRFLRRFEGFNCAAGSEDLLHLIQHPHLMNLPEIDVVRLQSPQGLFEIRFRALTSTLGRFRREKNVLPEWRQDISVDLFRSPVPVDPGGIEIVDAEFVGAQRNR